MFKVPEKYRVKAGHMASSKADGNNGMFVLPGGLIVIASDRDGWEQASVSAEKRRPLLDEMIQVRHLFWDKSDTVIQIYPPSDRVMDYVPYYLHLWRPKGVNISMPRLYDYK